MKKIAIITGASGGIGRAVAGRLAHDGFDTVIHYLGNDAKARETADIVSAAGAKALLIAGNVAEPTDVKELFAATMTSFGRVDVVVNCAGSLLLSPIAKGDIEQFDETIRSNLRGTFVVLAEAVRHLKEDGRIIAFSSSVIAKSAPGYGAYIAAKAGVEGLVSVLASELRGRKICVNAVAPGPVATELFLKGKSKEQIDAAAKAAPLERLGEPLDIAKAVSFLAGPDGAWVNGQILRVNGGFA